MQAGASEKLVERSVPAANEPMLGNHLMTDQDIMSCMNAEKLWQKVRKRAAEGRILQTPQACPPNAWMVSEVLTDE